MWLRLARNRLLIRTVAAALTLFVCGGTVDWGHLGGDDPDCNLVFVPHDHTAHRFSTAPSSGTPAQDHCYICHSLRLLHVALAQKHQRVTIDLHRAQLADSSNAIACQRAGVSLSSRAPPAAL
jgi:hypothetical protein